MLFSAKNKKPLFSKTISHTKITFKNGYWSDNNIGSAQMHMHKSFKTYIGYAYNIIRCLGMKLTCKSYALCTYIIQGLVNAVNFLPKPTCSYVINVERITVCAQDHTRKIRLM